VQFSLELPLIAILRGIRPEETPEHVQALLAVGFTAVEIPLNSPNWQVSIGWAIAEYQHRALIGGGTVLDIEHVDTLHTLGVRLVVTPNTNRALIRHAVDRQMVVIAGVATPTEAFDAIEAGAQALKIFPAAIYGPPFVRALRAVLPDIPMFAVGGITPANLADYLRAGCAGAGVGSELYRPGQPLSRTEAMGRAFIDAYRDAAA
jgi:2-dehydro-3-deoxyphosphogalactonate aldolase